MIKHSLKSFIKYGILTGIIIFIFLLLQKMVVPRFSSTYIVDGFYQEKENDIDVLFMGSSNMFCTIDPVALYEDYGIAAYNFGSSSQSLNISYLYLKEALKYQQPKIVVLEMLSSNSDTYQKLPEEALRWGFSNLKFSPDKYITLYDELGKIDFEYLSYIFPLLRYKDRWSELSKEDFDYLRSDKTNYDKGFYGSSIITEEEVNFDYYNEKSDFELASSNIMALEKIIDLCSKNNIQLMFFKSPTAKNWNCSMSEAILNYSQKYNITFIDYNEYIDDLKLDLKKDFRDLGHLNITGAQKVTKHMGAYLSGNYQLPNRQLDKQGNSWDTALALRKR